MSQAMRKTWKRCCGELPILRGHLIPHSYFPKEVDGTSTQLQGFYDASEPAFARVVYIRTVNHNGFVHVSLVMVKTKVSPIKRLTIPRLELCGALIIAKLLSHVEKSLIFPPSRSTPGQIVSYCSVGYVATHDASKRL